MIEVVQNVPAYIDDEPDRAFVANQLELLGLRWVARFQMPIGGKRFHRWSLAPDGPNPARKILVAEYDSGKHWWDVAVIVKGADQVNLPTWEDPTKARTA